MATLRFLLKRFAAQRLLGLAVVVTLAFSVGVLVAGPIYADAAREAILSSEVAGAAPTVKNARLQVFGDDSFDWEAADAGDHRSDRTRSRSSRSSGKVWGRSASGRPQDPPSRSSPAERLEQHLDDPRRASGRGRGGASRRRGAAARGPSRRQAGRDRSDRRADRAHGGRHLREPRARRPLLVRIADAVPGSRLDAATAGGGRPRHDRERHPGPRAHDPVLVGRVPRPRRRTVRAGLGRPGSMWPACSRACRERPSSDSARSP